MERTLCIDFGTSNSSACFVKNGKITHVDDDVQGSYLFPSYIMYQNGKPVVGSAAKAQFGSNKEVVIAAIKRLIGLNYDQYLSNGETGIYGCEIIRGDDGMPYCVIDKNTVKSPVEIASELFMTIKNKADKRMYPNKAEFAFITVPADYDQIRVKAIQKAAEMAGLKVTKFIREPTAAALCWCIPSVNSAKTGDKFLIYDFGGGTFDVSCVEYVGNMQFKVILTKGLKKVGGYSIDSLLVEETIKYMEKNDIPVLNRLKNEKKYQRRILALRKSCEEGKMVLINNTVYKQSESEYREVNSGNMEIDFSDLIDGDNEEYENTICHITLPQFDRITEPIITKSIDCVKATLEELHLQSKDIRYVLMVGGTSKIHQAKRRLVEMFPQSEFPDVDKELCVSNGAAQRLVCEYDPNAKVRVKDVLQCSYGTQYPCGVVLMVLKGDEIPTRSIPMHASINCKDEFIMTSICQYDGNVDQCRNMHHPVVNVVDCKKVHKVKIRNPDRQSNTKKKLEFVLKVHEDGTLELTCMDMDTGKMLESSICDEKIIV